MKTPYFLLAACLLGATAAQAQNSPAPAGIWEGSLDVSGRALRTVFELKGPAAALTGTLAVPQQGLTGMLLSSAIIRHDSLLLDADKIGGKFAGRFAADGQRVTGIWSQGGAQLPLTLVRSSAEAQAAAAPARPQEPKGPLPYRALDLTFPNAKGGFNLAGTLTLPQGKGPFPAVVLVSGSGPEDRDEAVFGHKPFLVLADYLTRRGFAVLRYDDRGTAKSGGTFAGALTTDFTADVQAALAYLRTRPDIKSRQVGLIGHSEGGLIAWQSAAQPQGPDFVVSLAGPGLPGDAILLRQQVDLARAAGVDSAAIGANRRLHTALFAALHRLPATATTAEATQQLAVVMQQQVPSLSAEQAQKQTGRLTAPWLRSFLLTDPATYLTKVKCPVLAINGTTDLQVAADENLPAIERGLKAARNSNVTVRALPGLNHLFQTDAAGTSHYAEIEETFAPSALKVVGDWLAKQTK
ncbi:alpha/beta hydrolase family protein [Hymenobacter lapidiphilus]|uniref:alpha/beta hydrolase family protein n=1 Tax=Hymenobacter sp. CCM 8763 TaxID=2303334 RepID=UPI00167D2E92|nr:alpha/beta fold hydrolase [Hymenobacter sp. CCM 8763]